MKNDLNDYGYPKPKTIPLYPVGYAAPAPVTGPQKHPVAPLHVVEKEAS